MTVTLKTTLCALTLCATGLAASAGIASADDDPRCTNEPFERWITVEQAAARATALGYQVRSIEADDGCYDIEARDADGRKMDILLHPITGEAVKVRRDR